MAAPDTTAQLSAKQPNAETVKPRTTNPNQIKNSSPSPFVPGVSLPVFPGISPTTTSSPIPTIPAALTWPLVEVPTPGLRATKANDPPSSTVKRRRVVVDEAPAPVKKRLKRREN